MLLLTTTLCSFAYLLGSISSAIIICRLWGLPDPRLTGSHNPGATNVLRIGGKIPALLTLFGDLLKGLIPVLLTLLIAPKPYVVGPVMLSAFLGHLFPAFFDFQGGKGVATSLGTIFALSWPLGCLWSATWLLVAFVFRYSSLAALTASALVPFYALFLVSWAYFIPLALMTVLIFWRHRENIHHLIEGTESKFGNNSKK